MANRDKILLQYEKLLENKPELLEFLTKDYAKNGVCEERLDGLISFLEPCIANIKEEKNIGEAIISAVQNELSSFLGENLNQIGYEDDQICLLLTGSEDDAVGNIVAEAFDKKQVYKMLDMLADLWMTKFPKQILQQICIVDFFD